MNISAKILETLVPVTKAIGRIHLPYTRKEITGYHFHSVLPLLKPGMVFLSMTKGEVTNLFIDGEWKHSAIFAPVNLIDFQYPCVIEAVGKGVSITDLITFMTTKDRLALLEPVFADDAQMEKAVKDALKFVDMPYDYYFKPGNKAFYCSELIAEAYETAMGRPVFERRLRMGVRTIIPTDYYKAKDKWRVVWQSHN